MYVYIYIDIYIYIYIYYIQICTYIHTHTHTRTYCMDRWMYARMHVVLSLSLCRQAWRDLILCCLPVHQRSAFTARPKPVRMARRIIGHV